MTEFLPPFQPVEYASGPRGPGNGGRAIAWIVIVISVVTIGGLNWRDSRRTAATAAVASGRVELPVQIMGRYAVGTNGLAVQSGNTDAAKMMLGELDTIAKTPADKLGAIAVVAELRGKEAALNRLASLMPTLPVEMRKTAVALQTLYQRGPEALTAAQNADLEDHLGWLAHLAKAFGKNDSDPQRSAVLSAARRTVVVMVAGGAIGIFALVLGLVLLIIVLVRLADHKVRLNYQPPVREHAGVFLEAFAIYVGGMTALFSAGRLPGFLQKSQAAHIALMVLPAALAIVWPILRGVNISAWRRGLGWHLGRGPFREIGLGLLGYITGLPILAVGFFVTFILITLAKAHPSHPIEHKLDGSKAQTLMVFLLASVYAPLTEETMFRGAFFHALRERHRWLPSALLSSFIFAAIHPQGWTVIPTLMSIAIVFAAIREWRGTILSSAAAHCMHNTVLLIFAITMVN